MLRDLAYYRLLPYEREWFMREEFGHAYYVVRLKDIPAVAGDGETLSDAVEDFHEAFDEFITAWLEAGKPIPNPSRGDLIPSKTERKPVIQWPSQAVNSNDSIKAEFSPSWAKSATVYTSNVVVDNSPKSPWLECVSAIRDQKYAATCQ